MSADEFKEGDRVIVTLDEGTLRTSRGERVETGDVCWVLRLVKGIAILKLDPGCPDIRGTFRVKVHEMRRY